METDFYWLVSPSGPTIHIAPSRHDASSWAIYLDDMLVSDGFGSPDEAAFKANRKDLEENARQVLSRIWVPAELSQWRTTKPEKPIGIPNANN